MPRLHSHRDSTGQGENNSVKGTFVSSSTLSTCSCLISKLLYPVYTQRHSSRLLARCKLDEVHANVDIHTLVRELRDKGERGRQDECTLHILILILSWQKCKPGIGDMSVISPESKEMRMSRMPCLVIDDSRTSVWMSTFVRTLSHSHLAKSLAEYQRWACKPGIRKIPRKSEENSMKIYRKLHEKFRKYSRKIKENSMKITGKFHENLR